MSNPWLAEAERSYNLQRLKFDATHLNLADSVTRAQRLAEREGTLAQVNTQVQELALLTQQMCEKSIADLVTRCLQAIFPENKYTFALVFEQKREQTECRCILRDDTSNEYDPVAACGGGVVAVICFALRLATLILRVPQASKVLILDEPFMALSAGHRGRLVGLLEALCQETGFQIIIVTHIQELTTHGNVIEL